MPRLTDVYPSRVGSPRVQGMLRGGGLTEGNGRVLHMLVYDSFVDPNGTSLDAHTPDTAPAGSAWIEAAGDWSIQTNQAQRDTVAAGSAFAIVDAGESDVIISVVIKSIVASDNAGIAFRYEGVNDWLIAYIDNGTNVVRIIKRDPGLSIVATSGPVTITDGNDYVMEVTLSGDSIKVSLDGLQVLDVNDSHNQTITSHGLYCERQNARFDAFQVTTL